LEKIEILAADPSSREASGFAAASLAQAKASMPFRHMGCGKG